MKKYFFALVNEKGWFIKFIYFLIIINVCALVIESYSVSDLIREILYYFEIFSIIVFTIEYIIRIWVADLNQLTTKGKIKARFNFIASFYGLIDLLAIMPFFLPFLIKIDLRYIRILRLFRLLRIFKIGRYSKSMQLISNVLRETKSELVVTIFICSVLMIFSSTLMYYIENTAQPEQFRNVGQSLWWAIATLTTVGYGDIYPITPLGKLLGAFIALIGIGFVALPTGIISSAFISKVNTEKKSIKKVKCVCPKCNETISIEIGD